VSEQSVATAILESIAIRGWAARLVPAARRFDLWRELSDRRARGELDEVFFEERLRSFGESIENAPEWIRSMLIVAIPDPMLRIRFNWRGREISLSVPPTFVRWDTLGEPRIQCLIKDHIASAVRSEIASVPKKLLATRSGLARYGRNNITYVEGMGSYHRLCSLYTDVPCGDTPWQEPMVLGLCGDCGACVRACPANAIDPDRFLVHAERCITYWQEKPSGVRHPADADYSWGDQFIGCMRCQAVCPQNRGMLATDEIGSPFTEEETGALLQGTTVEDLPKETVDKLKRHGIVEYLDVLPRNLGDMMKRMAAS